MDRLTANGYSHTWRKKVLEKALTGYRRILQKESQGISSRNRKGAQTALKRRFKKLVGSQEWFRLEEEDTEVQQYPRFRKGSRKYLRMEACYFLPIPQRGH